MQSMADKTDAAVRHSRASVQRPNQVWHLQLVCGRHGLYQPVHVVLHRHQSGMATCSAYLGYEESVRVILRIRAAATLRVTTVLEPRPPLAAAAVSACHRSMTTSITAVMRACCRCPQVLLTLYSEPSTRTAVLRERIRLMAKSTPSALRMA